MQTKWVRSTVCMPSKQDSDYEDEIMICYPDLPWCGVAEFMDGKWWVIEQDSRTDDYEELIPSDDMYWAYFPYAD